MAAPGLAWRPPRPPRRGPRPAPPRTALGPGKGVDLTDRGAASRAGPRERGGGSRWRRGALSGIALLLPTATVKARRRQKPLVESPAGARRHGGHSLAVAPRPARAIRALRRSRHLSAAAVAAQRGVFAGKTPCAAPCCPQAVRSRLSPWPLALRCPAVPCGAVRCGAVLRGVADVALIVAPL